MAPVHFGLPLLDLSLLARAVKRGRLAIASPLESAPRKSSIPPGSRNGAFFDAHPQAAWRQRLLSFTRITTTIVDFLPVSQRKYYRRQRGDNAGTTSVVKNWMQKLGEDIARARRKVSMTQEELRLATGLSRNTIGHYERGNALRISACCEELPLRYPQISSKSITIYGSYSPLTAKDLNPAITRSS